MLMLKGVCPSCSSPAVLQPAIGHSRQPKSFKIQASFLNYPLASKIMVRSGFDIMTIILGVQELLGLLLMQWLHFLLLHKGEMLVMLFNSYGGGNKCISCFSLHDFKSTIMLLLVEEVAQRCWF